MAQPDRAGLIELLNQLRSTDDATVLAAARALQRKTEEAGVTWEELIRQDEDDEPLDTAPASEDIAPPDADGAEVTRLIDRLLRKGVSDELRVDLIEMKRQVADGSLDAMDARYVRALVRRLGG